MRLTSTYFNQDKLRLSPTTRQKVSVKASVADLTYTEDGNTVPVATHRPLLVWLGG
jgi:hypothetical protein